MKETASTSGGIGFFGALALAFIVLKLAKIGGAEHWSWWWVTAPLWLPFIVVFVLVAAFHSWLELTK